DWGMFHVEPRFFSAWRVYRRTLIQRNRALRQRASQRQVSVWDDQLARSATIIDNLRQQYVAALVREVPASILTALGAEAPQIDYFRGWKADSDYLQVLAGSLAADQRLGFTQSGPHRADMRLSVRGVRARSQISR